MGLTGQQFHEMLKNGANALFLQKDRLNKLNVFPIPDGDTGINMYSTLSPVLNVVVNDYSLDKTASLLSYEMLKASRGNSGTILATFFLGLSEHLKGIKEGSINDIIQAFKAGKEYSYKNIANPQEGTILTVMSDVCNVKANDFNSIEELFENMKDRAEISLKRTPELLPVLKKAGVVDSGGFGFTIILEAMYDSLIHNPIKMDENGNQPLMDKYSDVEFNFTYSIECVVEKSEDIRGLNKCPELKDIIAGLGDCQTYIETQKMIKFILLSDDENKVLRVISSYGNVILWNVANIKENLANKKEKLDYAIVPVLMGDGFLEVFSNVGAKYCVDGGKNMNVSYETLKRTVSSTNARTVFILPNNKDTIPTCNLLASREKNCHIVVVPTLNMAQGAACCLAFNCDASAEENELAMRKAMEKVEVFLITTAIKDSTVGELDIKVGDCVVLYKSIIIASFKNEVEAMNFVANYLLKYSAITFYYGDEVSELEASKLANVLQEKVGDDSDVILVYGGQGIYRYIISGE